MKKILISLLILASLVLPVGCSNNAETNNYENTDENNEMEDLYEDEMGAPEQEVGYIIIEPTI